MKVGYQILADLQQQQAFKQWGYLQKQAEKWIYPIPVLEAFIATKTCISNNHSAAGYVGYWTWDKDITTEYAYSWNNYPSYCFMIGKVQQQWGYQTVHGTNPVTYDLPIPFEEAPFTVAISTGNSGNHASCGGFTKTTIVLRAGTTAGVWDTVGFFIIGCQLQWGASGYAVTFPIAFNVVYNVLSIPQTTASTSNAYWGRFYITALNKNGFNVSDTGAGSNRWIAIGSAQQQWGYQKQLTVEPVVYPLPVNTVCCVWAHSIHDRQDPGTYHSILSKITPVGVQILAGQYNAPATAYSGISAYWGMIGW